MFGAHGYMPFEHNVWNLMGQEALSKEHLEKLITKLVAQSCQTLRQVHQALEHSDDKQKE